MSKTIITNHILQVVTNTRLWEGGVAENIFLVEKEDISSIVNIENICFDANYYDSLLTENSIKYLIKNGNSLLLINKFNKKLTGYAQIKFKKNLSSARFYSLAVLPEFQGTSVANLLFKSVEKTCQLLGISCIQLEIRQDNKALNYRYKKIGYQQYQVIKNYYPDGCAAIKMSKMLL